MSTIRVLSDGKRLEIKVAQGWFGSKAPVKLTVLSSRLVVVSSEKGPANKLVSFLAGGVRDFYGDCDLFTLDGDLDDPKSGKPVGVSADLLTDYIEYIRSSSRIQTLPGSVFCLKFYWENTKGRMAVVVNNPKQIKVLLAVHL